MAKPLHEPGVVVDDYRLEELAHSGGMATLWRVSRPGVTMPLLMKVPRIGEGADPAAIVSFEMEQMILPRLTGVHVPKFVAAGDFAAQPYIVMEAIPGQTLLPRLPELPLPDAEVAKIGAKIAMALDDLHRQHVVHLDIKPSNIMFRPTGEAVLLDYGLSHHFRLPDLMQEEFRLPFGTAPCSHWASFLISFRPACGRSAKARRCAGCAVGSGAIRCRRAACGATIRPGCRKSCCAASRSSRPGAIRRRRSWLSI